MEAFADVDKLAFSRACENNILTLTACAPPVRLTPRTALPLLILPAYVYNGASPSTSFSATNTNAPTTVGSLPRGLIRSLTAAPSDAPRIKTPMIADPIDPCTMSATTRYQSNANHKE
jgi:hypothetical protein